MNSKRGQITIFLVIGIVILFVAAGTFFLVSYVTKEKLGVEEKESLSALQTKPLIRSFVESCLEQTALPGVYALGRLGGTLFPEELNALTTEDEVISYGFLNGETRLSRDRIEKDLDFFIEETLDECIDGFSVFAEQAFSIEAGEKKSSAVVRFDKINLALEYPLKVKVEEDSFIMKDFSASIPIRLGFVIDRAKKIISLHEENPVYDLPAYSNTGATIIAFPFDDVTTVFSVYDEKSTTGGIPYFFWFVLKDETVNSPPVLDLIPDFVLTMNVPFEYEVKASDADNDKLVFSSSSSDFPISEEGLFNFTPTNTGTLFVNVFVEDVAGLRDEQQVRFIIENPIGEKENE